MQDCLGGSGSGVWNKLDGPTFFEGVGLTNFCLTSLGYFRVRLQSLHIEFRLRNG